MNLCVLRGTHFLCDKYMIIVSLFPNFSTLHSEGQEDLVGEITLMTFVLDRPQSVPAYTVITLVMAELVVHITCIVLCLSHALTLFSMQP